MNKGTSQGNQEEINFVKELNTNKDTNLWNILGLENNSNLYAVRCTTNKESKISKSKVLPKTDVFIIKTSDTIVSTDFFIDEDILKEQNINFTYIPNSGISIKEKDSKSFTYQKMTIETFFKIFKNYELGCAIEYYTGANDRNKNIILEKAWHTDRDKIIEVIKTLKSELNYDKNLKLSDDKEIKQTAISLTKFIINNNNKISDFIFRGVGAFNDPFYINYLYKEGKLISNCYPSKYSITTGSGRSKKQYTVVIKP